ncbi:hypothetical protein [Maribacter sp.]|uniref:hypothetical protein n=1 Tax=Maribacter sp. TaxID=1897614 RepID=UPI0025B99DD6|nr:hypothetical protein [Maribacter sp.]
MTKTLTLLVSCISLFSYGQNAKPNQIPKKIFSNVEIEFGVNNEVTYDYDRYSGDRLISGATTDLDNKTSFGLLYNINYPIFNKLTVGAVGGIQYQSQLKISALKLGGILRYHFRNYESININLMTAYNIALSDNITSEMGNVRFGIQFPITRTDAFNVNLNVFSDYNFYGYKRIVLNEAFERPSNVIYRSFGFSLGVQF